MNFKLGRRRPAHDAKKLRFKDYRNSEVALVPPPRVVHWSEQLKQGGSYACMTNVMYNDTIGCCTCSGAAHIVGLGRGVANNGDRMPVPDDARNAYVRWCNYVIGDPSTDQGGDEVTVMNLWKQGFFADGTGKIATWVTVNGASENQVKQAIWLFENVYFGVELPDAWTQNEPQENGFVWDVAGDPNPQSGHCFVGLDYNDVGVIIDTWGLIGTVTWAAVAKYTMASAGGQLSAVLLEDAVDRATAKAPNGIAWKQLLADSKSL